MGRKPLGKGEIACHEQFLLYPKCFQKARFPGASKGAIVWEWVKLIFFCHFKLPLQICRERHKTKAYSTDKDQNVQHMESNLQSWMHTALSFKPFTLYNTITSLHTPADEKVFQNILGKGENAGDQHFLLFQKCFLHYQ